MPDVLTGLSEWTNAKRKLVWLVLFLLLIAIVVVVLTPVFLIMPFKAQTPRIMEVSYVMRRWSPLLTVVGSLLMLTLTIGLWSGGRWWSRTLSVLLLLPVLGATWFNPLPNPAYAKSREVDFIDDNDRVLAVAIGGESVAYPVRLMAYHHVVEDTVGGTPIVATY
jgi:amino acid transporter